MSDSQGVNSVRNDKFERKPKYFLRKRVLFSDVYHLHSGLSERDWGQCRQKEETGLPS